MGHNEVGKGVLRVAGGHFQLVHNYVQEPNIGVFNSCRAEAQIFDDPAHAQQLKARKGIVVGQGLPDLVVAVVGGPAQYWRHARYLKTVQYWLKLSNS